MEITNITLADLAKRLHRPYEGHPVAAKINGITVRDLFPIGARVWFEYHCWESPESSDAEIWYRSHQQVVILDFAKCDPPAFTTFKQRNDAGESLLYRVRFDDGLEWDIFEDEIYTDPKNFCRPDPPKGTVEDTHAASIG